MYDLELFLNGEGAIFEDFIKVLGDGNVKGITRKYKDKNELEFRQPYINRLDNAATKWKEIVKISHKELYQSVDNLIDIIKIKYGDYSPVAQKLVNRYREVQEKLVQKGESGKYLAKDQGYVPHYVLNLLAKSLEMRDKLDVTREFSKNELDEFKWR